MKVKIIGFLKSYIYIYTRCRMSHLHANCRCRASHATQEIQADCYLTFHRPVVATARRQDRTADARCIELTTCEGRELLLTTEAMDFGIGSVCWS